jgi:hypothetical protein
VGANALRSPAATACAAANAQAAPARAATQLPAVSGQPEQDAKSTPLCREVLGQHINAKAVAFRQQQNRGHGVAPGVGKTLLMAREHMIHQGVRLLFVVSDMPCVDGLITTTDLDGERPMQGTACGGVRYDDPLVADVVSPLATLDAVGMDDLRRATVAKAIATIRQLGRRHMLVVDHGQDSQTPVLRGVTSQTQIERQPGQTINVIEQAHNFAEISASLLS